MKKVLFIISCFLMIATTMNAQSASQTASLNSFKSIIYRNALAKLTDDARPYYKKGQTVENFCTATGSNFKSLSKNEQNLATELFTNISKNLSYDQVAKSGNASVIENLIKNPSSNSTGGAAKIGLWGKIGRALVAVGVAINAIVCCFDPNCP